MSFAAILARDVERQAREYDSEEPLYLVHECTNGAYRNRDENRFITQKEFDADSEKGWHSERCECRECKGDDSEY